MKNSSPSSPLVSIAIPCYNHGKYVQETIKSVLSQTYANIELIIIDDGSQDDSVERIAELAPLCESRFARFEFRARPNQGLSSTLNEALSWSRGEYFGPIASDDVMLPHKVALQVSYLEANPLVKAVHGGAYILSTNGTIIAERNVTEKVYGFREIIRNDYNLFTASQLLDRSVVSSVGGYRKGIKLEDWYLLLKITEAGYKVSSIDTIVVGYRRHKNNISNNVSMMHVERKTVLDLFSHSTLYNEGVTGFYYTLANELVAYSRRDALKNLIRAILRDGSYLLSIKTYKILAKLLLPRAKLLRRLEGEG